MPAIPKRVLSALTLFVTFGVLFATAFVITRSRMRPATPVSPLIGHAAPDFALTDLDGTTVSLASLKGHVVVLDFWATWCPPCVAEMPVNVAVTTKFAGRGVQFFAVNVSDTPDMIHDFLQREHLATRVLLSGGPDMPLRYGVDYLPLLVVIDANGRVTASDTLNPDEINSTLSGWIENALKAGQAA